MNVWCIKINQSEVKQRNEMKWKYELNSIPIHVQMQTEIKCGSTAKRAKAKQTKPNTFATYRCEHVILFSLFFFVWFLVRLNTWVLVMHKSWYFCSFSCFLSTSRAIFSFQSSFSRYSVKLFFSSFFWWRGRRWDSWRTPFLNSHSLLT